MLLDNDADMLAALPNGTSLNELAISNENLHSTEVIRRLFSTREQKTPTR